MRVGVTGSSASLARRWWRHSSSAATTSCGSCDQTRRQRRVDSLGSFTGLVDDNDVRRVGALEAVVNLAGAASLIVDGRTSAKRRYVAHVATRRRCWCESSVIRRARVSREWLGNRRLRVSRAEVLDESSSIGDDSRSRVRRVGTGDVTARAIRNESGAPSHGIVMSSRGGALKKQLPLFRLGLAGS